jgi:hypothetical protein
MGIIGKSYLCTHYSNYQERFSKWSRRWLVVRQLTALS